MERICNERICDGRRAGVRDFRRFKGRRWQVKNYAMRGEEWRGDVRKRPEWRGNERRRSERAKMRGEPKRI